MRRTRWLGRGIAAAIVVGGVALVYAASGVNLVAVPPVIDVHVALNTAGSNLGQLQNTGDTSATVSAIVADGSCAGNGVTATGMPGAPFNVPGFNATHSVVMGCTSSSIYGIRRCQQHVIGGGGQTLTSLTGLCMTEGTSMFMPGQSALMFPSTMVNTTSAPQTVMISNPAGNPMSSLLSIQIGDQDGNFLITAPCPGPTLGCDAPVLVGPNAIFSVSVVCKPQSIGAHSALLYIVGNGGSKLMPPISLSCMGMMVSGNPALSVNPGSVSLMHEVGMGSVSTTVHVSNIGGSDLHIASITQAGSTDWTYSTGAPCATFPCTVVAPTSFDLTATFTPTALFARDATLTINSDDPNDAMFQLPLAGTGQGALLRLASNLGTPPMLDLGTSPIGIPTTAAFDLGNNGNITLDPVNLAITQMGNELAVSPNPTSISASGTRQITITCTPTAASLYTGTIEITAPTAMSGSPISIDVRCTGTAGNLFATPSSLQLGEIRTGSPRVTRTIMLKTAGPQLMITSNPSLAMPVGGMAVTAPSSSTITVATPSTFDLTVDAVADEDLANQIDVTATAALVIPVTGKVVTAKIDVPTSIVVGSFCVGQPTTSTPVALAATGTATIGLGAQPVMNRMSTSPFQLAYTSPVSYPYQLPAGQAAAVSVIPLRQTEKGTQTDDLVWTTDVVGQEAPRTAVSAVFIADGGAIAPQLVDFGAVKLRDTAAPRLVKIQNCGTDPMTLSGPTIAPTGEFRDASGAALPQTLAPNQVATIEVTFVPTKTGLRKATLTVDSSKGPLGVMLTGQGLADPGKTSDPKSFYACDCKTSDPTGAWPALLVLVVLRRRRRR